MKIDRLYFNQDFQSQQEVFHFLGQVMQQLHIVEDAQSYVSALEEREEEFSTGLVDGFAIPHGKSSLIQEGAVVYIRNTHGIDWETLDGSLVTDIFALAIPNDSTNEHLDTLIHISTQLANDSICQKIKEAQKEEDIINLF